MNFYPFHIGDYTSHTAHLEPLEDLAYRRMLDVYYTREAPLPLDPAEVARLIRMRSHIREVEDVLREFFDRTDEGWRNTRAEAVLADLKVKQERQREKANKRWHKPGAEPGSAAGKPEESHGNAVAYAVASNTDAVAMPPIPIPIPNTSSLRSEVSCDEQEKKPRAVRKCPEAFAPDASLIAWARTTTPAVDFERELEKFRDHTFARSISDWAGALRNWLRRAEETAQERARRSPRGGAAPTESFAERDTRLKRERWEEMTGRQWPGDARDSRVLDASPLELLQ